MSLKASIRKATRHGLKVAQSSIAEKIVYNQVQDPVYDTDSGEATRPSSKKFTIDAWFTSFKEMHVDGNNVQPGDQRCTFEVLDLAITPNMHDFLLDAAGDQWEVINIKLPPPKILYILHVRRP